MPIIFTILLFVWIGTKNSK